MRNNSILRFFPCVFVIISFVFQFCNPAENESNNTPVYNIYRCFSPQKLELLQQLNKKVDSLNSNLEQICQYYKEVNKLEQISQTTINKIIEQQSSAKCRKLRKKLDALCRKNLCDYISNSATIAELYRDNLVLYKDSLPRYKKSIDSLINNTVTVDKIETNKITVQISIDSLVCRYEETQKKARDLISKYFLFTGVSQEEATKEIERFNMVFTYLVEITMTRKQLPFSKLEKLTKNKQIFLDIDSGVYKYSLGLFDSKIQADSFINIHRLQYAKVKTNRGGLEILFNTADSFNKGSIIYRIQVAATSDSVSRARLKSYLQKHDSLKIEKNNGLLKYKLGYFETYKEATRFKLENNLKDAFIVKEEIVKQDSTKI